MPAANQVWTEELTDTYTTERYPRGTLRLENPAEVKAISPGAALTPPVPDHFGERIWIFVHNDEAGAFAQGDVLEMGDDAGTGATGTVPFEAVKSNTLAQELVRVIGVAGHAIPNDHWGWVIARGYCEVMGDGGVAAGDYIVTKAAGVAETAVARAADATVGTMHAVFGLALEADAPIMTALIDCL